MNGNNMAEKGISQKSPNDAQNFRVGSKSSGRWCNSKHNTSFGPTTLKARVFLGVGGGLNHFGKIEFSLNKR